MVRARAARTALTRADTAHAPMAQPGLQAWPPPAAAIAAYKERLNEQDIMDVFARLLITDTPE